MNITAQGSELIRDTRSGARRRMQASSRLRPPPGFWIRRRRFGFCGKRGEHGKSGKFPKLRESSLMC